MEVALIYRRIIIMLKIQKFIPNPINQEALVSSLMSKIENVMIILNSLNILILVAW